MRVRKVGRVAGKNGADNAKNGDSRSERAADLSVGTQRQTGVPGALSKACVGKKPTKAAKPNGETTENAAGGKNRREKGTGALHVSSTKGATVDREQSALPEAARSTGGTSPVGRSGTGGGRSAAGQVGLRGSKPRDGEKTTRAKSDRTKPAAVAGGRGAGTGGRRGKVVPAEDLALAESAKSKRLRKQKPTREEAAALRRVETVHEEEQLRAKLSNLPKGLFCELARRSHKVVLDHAKYHGAPTLGRTIDLFEFVSWVFDYHAENKNSLHKQDTGDTAGSIDGDRAREELRLLRLRADRQETALARERGEWIPRAEVHEGFAVLAGTLRNASERLARSCGANAQQILDEGLDDVAREFASRFDDGDMEENANGD